MRMEDNVKSSRNISAIDHPKEESAPRARVGKGKELESPLDKLIKSHEGSTIQVHQAGES